MLDGSTFSSYIDLTITNDKCTNSITDWKIDNEKLITEHNLIEFKLRIEENEEENSEQVIKFNFKKMNISTFYNTFDLIRPEIDDEKDLNRLCEDLLNSIVQSCAASTTMIKINKKSKKSQPWFNQHLRDLREEIENLLKIKKNIRNREKKRAIESKIK